MRKIRTIIATLLMAMFVLGTLSAQASEPVPVTIVTDAPKDWAAALETLGRWDEAVALSISKGTSCDPVPGVIVICFTPNVSPVFSHNLDGEGVAYVRPTSSLVSRKRHIRQDCRDARRPRTCKRRQIRFFINQPIQAVICHEVGHGLGLGHNNRGTSCLGGGWMPDATDLAEAAALHH